MATLAAMAALSAVGLMWEIVVTRLASALLSYHYAFVAVSLAVLGLGLGAALAYGLPVRHAVRLAAPAANGASLSFLLVAALTPSVATQGAMAGLVALALLPFVMLGVAVSVIFRAYGLASPRLYAADLAGASVGTLAAIVALDAAGPFTTLFILAALSACTALLLGAPVAVARGWVRVLAVLLLCLGLGGAAVQAARSPLGIDYAALQNAPPDKTIVPLLRDPAQHARIIATHWDAFARTDMVATSDPTRRLLFTDGGAGSYMVAWNGDAAARNALHGDLETLPLLLGPHASVLVIGAGGGIDVVRALSVGARRVTAVELSQASVDAVRAARSYNGNILDRAGVTTIVDDGRHFLARSHARYDAILLNLVYSGAAEGTSHALAESYIFTTEAFRMYLNHLTPRGRIGIISHQALEGLRAFTTGLEALHQNGLSYADAMLRATVLMTDNQTPEARPTLTVVQNAPFRQAELTLLRTRGTGDLNLRPLYVPYLYRGNFGDLVTGNQTLAQFLRGSDYAIDPTADDRPFFFNLNLGLPDGLTTALWYAFLVVAGMLALVFFLRPAADERPGGVGHRADPPGTIWILGLYMALLGCGFMCVEVPIIQRFILLLGEPVLALGVVLATLLLAGGAGSALGGRLFARSGMPSLAPLAVAAVVAVAVLVLPWLTTVLLTLSPAASIIGAILALIPLGVALGMPFPLGLRLAARLLPGDIALLWSINALCSVLGSVGAAIIAVQYGFVSVLLTGAACYAVAAASLYLVAARLRTA